MKKTNHFAGIRILIAPALLFIFLILNGCMNTNNPTYTKTSTTTTGTQGANEVYIQGMAFSPVTLTVTAGTTVTWTNKDAMTHTVTSDSPLFDSGNIAVNGVYSYTFNTAGTFAYHCTYHPSMKATVIVNPYVAPSGY
ncbi:MAG: cupredoxin family copper-binding protein [Paludibacter sp.]|nr:cupredoxin family copper-binding protein [Paludibacter sp.]